MTESSGFMAGNRGRIVYFKGDSEFSLEWSYPYFGERTSECHAGKGLSIHKDTRKTSDRNAYEIVFTVSSTGMFLPQTNGSGRERERSAAREVPNKGANEISVLTLTLTDESLSGITLLSEVSEFNSRLYASTSLYDVVCVQHISLLMQKDLFKKFKPTHPNSSVLFHPKNCSVAFFSKYPIIKMEYVPFSLCAAHDSGRKYIITFVPPKDIYAPDEEYFFTEKDEPAAAAACGKAKSGTPLSGLGSSANKGNVSTSQGSQPSSEIPNYFTPADLARYSGFISAILYTEPVLGSNSMITCVQLPDDRALTAYDISARSTEELDKVVRGVVPRDNVPAVYGARCIRSRQLDFILSFVNNYRSVSAQHLPVSLLCGNFEIDVFDSKRLSIAPDDELLLSVAKEISSRGDITFCADIVEVLHAHGLRAKPHLGAIREWLDTERLRRLALTEIVARTVKDSLLMKARARLGTDDIVGYADWVVKEIESTFSSWSGSVLRVGFQGSKYEELKRHAMRLFPGCLTPEEQEQAWDIKTKIIPVQLLRAIQRTTHIFLAPEALAELEQYLSYGEESMTKMVHVNTKNLEKGIPAIAVDEHHRITSEYLTALYKHDLKDCSRTEIKLTKPRNESKTFVFLQKQVSFFIFYFYFIIFSLLHFYFTYIFHCHLLFISFFFFFFFLFRKKVKHFQSRYSRRRFLSREHGKEYLQRFHSNKCNLFFSTIFYGIFFLLSFFLYFFLS